MTRGRGFCDCPTRLKRDRLVVTALKGRARTFHLIFNGDPLESM